jgi:hypothetical protein
MPIITDLHAQVSTDLTMADIDTEVSLCIYSSNAVPN